MAKLDSLLPAIKIEADTHRAAKVNSAQEGITITAYLRAALRLWKRGDPISKRIVEEARKK